VNRTLVAIAGAAILAPLALGACSTSFSSADATLHACADVYSSARCEAILAAAAERLDVEPVRVTTVDIGPAVTLPPGVVTLSGPRPFFVTLTIANGSKLQTTIECPGISSMFRPECMNDPHVVLSSPTMGGYSDVPQGASPVPSADPDLVAKARAIEVKSLVIKADHVGPYEVEIGRGSLPNGILSLATFDLTDPWPDGIRFTENQISLAVKPLDPSRPPIYNIYEHGWRPGLEQVKAVLVFDVARADPGATFEIRNVVVE
jgi:hypothetical protein